MPAVDSTIVFAPRFTTLVGATTFTTLPLDVSRYGGAQFQVWRSTIRTNGGATPTFQVSMEESLDTKDWVLGPSTPQPFTIGADDVKMFSYNFRLRWFRLKFEITGTDPIVTCWAEGLLRGGGGGLWHPPPRVPQVAESLTRVPSGLLPRGAIVPSVTPPAPEGGVPINYPGQFPGKKNEGAEDLIKFLQ